MARIRSVHPGLFTDESFMALTLEAPLAVVLLIGLWTEADDAGTFEWKPLSIKARVLPAIGGADVLPLFDALLKHRFIARYAAADDRQYGAIRNFAKYQRPRFPKTTHPQPPDIQQYVGLNSSDYGKDRTSADGQTERPPDKEPPLPRTAEGPPQMEDGVGEEEVEGQQNGKYEFAGRLIRITAPDADRWRKSYPFLGDLTAELQSLDDYYDRTLSGAEREASKVFHRTSAALRKRNERAALEARPGNGSRFDDGALH